MHMLLLFCKENNTRSPLRWDIFIIPWILVSHNAVQFSLLLKWFVPGEFFLTAYWHNKSILGINFWESLDIM